MPQLPVMLQRGFSLIAGRFDGISFKPCIGRDEATLLDRHSAESFNPSGQCSVQPHIQLLSLVILHLSIFRRLAIFIFIKTVCRHVSIISNHFLFTSNHFSIILPHFSIIFNHFSVVFNHFSFTSNHFSIIFNHFSVVFYHFSVVFNHFSVVFNHFSVVFNHFSVIFRSFSSLSPSFFAHFRALTCPRPRAPPAHAVPRPA
jgi:hypothetical protein